MTPDQLAALTVVVNAGGGPRESLRKAWLALDRTLHGDADVVKVCVCLAVMAAGDRRPGHEHCVKRLELIDGRTGLPVDDPDAFAASNPRLRGLLAAARVVTCAGNQDFDTARDLVFATIGTDAPDAACVLHSFCDTLADAAAHTMRARATGADTTSTMLRLPREDAS